MKLISLLLDAHVIASFSSKLIKRHNQLTNNNYFNKIEHFLSLEYFFLDLEFRKSLVLQQIACIFSFAALCSPSSGLIIISLLIDAAHFIKAAITKLNATIRLFRAERMLNSFIDACQGPLPPFI